MNSILLSVTAAGSASLANLSYRKYSTSNGDATSPNGYLLVFYFFSFLTSLIFYPEVFTQKPNYIVLAIGALVGVLNVSLMLLTSKALTKGPSGLTFAIQNTSAVFPGLLLFFFFGSDFGFSFSFMQCAGVALVLAGLFLGVRGDNNDQEKTSKTWLIYAFACFFVQIVALTLIQARCVLFECEGKDVFFSFLSVNRAEDIWFMPGLFGMGTFLQSIFFACEKRGFSKAEVSFGLLGGLFNFGSTCLLLLATKFAVPSEKAILFPCFAVSTIVFCNAWANRLYHEDFKLASTALCGLGIFIGILA
ncbi:MAG: hypothetical protein WC222_10930 [Parachlamydiales bacterium]|jgi:hypothetical protein